MSLSMSCFIVLNTMWMCSFCCLHCGLVNTAGWMATLAAGGRSRLMDFSSSSTRNKEKYNKSGWHWLVGSAMQWRLCLPLASTGSHCQLTVASCQTVCHMQCHTPPQRGLNIFCLLTNLRPECDPLRTLIMSSHAHAHTHTHILLYTLIQAGRGNTLFKTDSVKG